MKQKFNLDREPLDSSFIQSKQDFDKVIKGYRAMKPPIWKNPWFYGPVGLASLAVILTLTFQNNFFASDNNSTLNTSLQNVKNQLPEDTPCIKPLSAEADVEFEKHPIDPSKGGTITTDNGTIIQIDPNSLETVGKDGVVIKVREFPDQATAFAAGIPMDYGKASAFESGGMIEIRGEQNGTLITINPDKPIEVDMTLRKSGADFTFWSMNDKTGEWTDYPCEFTSNQESSVLKPKKVKSKQPEIRDVQEKIEICDKNIASIKEESDNQELIPIANARKLVVDFDAKSFPELAGYKDIEFEYLLPTVQSAANMSKFERRIKYASTQTWNDMAVSKKNGNDYIVTFKNRREAYSVPVRPVLKGNSLAQLENEMANADKLRKEKVLAFEVEKIALEKREKELKAKFEKDVNDMKAQLNKYVAPTESQSPQRSESSKSISSVRGSSFSTDGRSNFVTSGFGVFNCDRSTPYPKEFNQPVLCKSESGKHIAMAGAFVFDHKKNTRFSFGSMNGRKIDELAWNKGKSTLILIDMDGNMFYKKEVNKDPLDDSTVILQRISRKDVNLEEIQKILNEDTVTA